MKDKNILKKQEMDIKPDKHWDRFHPAPPEKVSSLEIFLLGIILIFALDQKMRNKRKNVLRGHSYL